MADPKPVKRQTRADEVRDILVFTTFALILGGPVLLVMQGYQWLRHGIWPHWTLASALMDAGATLSSIYYPTDWAGVARIAAWVLELPASLASFLAGFALLFTLSAIRGE